MAIVSSLGDVEHTLGGAQKKFDAADAGIHAAMVQAST
jgi:hypothetical protein